MSVIGVGVHVKLSSATQAANVQIPFYILRVGFYKLVSGFRHIGTPCNGQIRKILRPALFFCSLFTIHKGAGAVENSCTNVLGHLCEDGLRIRYGSWWRRCDDVETRPKPLNKFYSYLWNQGAESHTGGPGVRTALVTQQLHGLNPPKGLKGVQQQALLSVHGPA